MISHFLNGTRAKIFSGLFIIFFFNLPSSIAETDNKADRQEILAIGTGTVVQDNVANARKTAISEALIKGVEEYLARRLGSQGMITNFPRLIHDVIPRARDGIENFNILAEEQIGKKYKILVRLKINEKVMEEKFRELGLILMEGPPIKVLFLVSQHEPRKGKTIFWWKEPESESGLTPTELALHRVFQEHGFSPINRLVSLPEENYSPDMKTLDLSDEDAIIWGRLFSADVVIRGRCEIIEENMVSVSLIALDKEKGFIYQDNQTEKADKASGGMEQFIQTIEKAVNKIAARMVPLVIKAIQIPEVKPNQLEITLKGLRNFKQFREFRDFLKKEMKEVKSVKQTRVRADSITISVEFTGDEDKFLEMVLNHENLPFEAEMSKTDKEEIIIKIR